MILNTANVALMRNTKKYIAEEEVAKKKIKFECDIFSQS